MSSSAIVCPSPVSISSSYLSTGFLGVYSICHSAIFADDTNVALLIDTIGNCEFSEDGRLYIVSATILYAFLHPVLLSQRVVAVVLVFPGEVLLLSHQSEQPSDCRAL